MCRLRRFPERHIARASAYGRDNDRASWPGYDYLMQAETGKARRMSFEEVCDVAMTTSHYLKNAKRILALRPLGGVGLGHRSPPLLARRSGSCTSQQRAAPDTKFLGPVDVLWSKYRWYCEESACDRLSFFESTPQVPRRARSTSRLRNQLVDAVIRSGRAVSETAAGFAVSWWMVRAAVTEACLLQLPERREGLLQRTFP